MPFRGTIGIDGYVMVYSVASRTSMETVKVLDEKIINESGTATVPRVLVGNKSDLHNDRSISVEEGKRTAEELNCAFIECSAKHNENICTCTFLDMLCACYVLCCVCAPLHVASKLTVRAVPGVQPRFSSQFWRRSRS